MIPTNNNYEVSNYQPLPENLRRFLPVNYYLLVKSSPEQISNVRKVKSKFHNTPEYRISLFYKTISSIL